MFFCLAINSINEFSECFHFKSGFLLNVPKPVQGASTSTLSNFSFNLLILLSFSLEILCIEIFDAPDLFNLVFKLSNLLSEISKLYILPVFFIIAVMANVLPPAPAQKSATICPLFASAKYDNN